MDSATKTEVKTRVFLTGAAGNWGRAVLDQFRARADRFDVVALVLPEGRDLEAIRQYEDMTNLEVVFGDLTDPAAVDRCVQGADLVLHIGGVVSPFADERPDLARKVNIGSMRNIIRAVKRQKDPSRIGVVGVGSVAETGHRSAPHHWGRIGDPLRVSMYDEYGQTKVVAEKMLVDSGLPRWAWLRQTGILYPGMLQVRDPILTHSVLDGVLEWVSVEDAARLMAGIAEEFWGGVYNIGGGDGWRLTNWQLQVAISSALGVRDVCTWYDRNWFATQNFHGHWFTDSDTLQDLVPFRQDTFDQALTRAVRANPRLRAAGFVPGFVVKKLVMEPLTRKPRGTIAYVHAGDEEGINAFYGSIEAFESIGDWSTFWPPRPSRTPTRLEHGYDQDKAPASWGFDDYQQAAQFRGGVLLDEEVPPGDIAHPLRWRCGLGHEFNGSPRLILSAGHWCPECVRDVAGYAQQAERNRFLAQLEPSRPTRPSEPSPRNRPGRPHHR